MWNVFTQLRNIWEMWRDSRLYIQKGRRSDGEFLSQVTKLNERLGDGINKAFNVDHSDSTHSLCKFGRCANVVESMRESSFLARLL